MSIEFKDSTEALVAIGTVMIAADKIGTMTEKNSLLNELKKLTVFNGYDSSRLNRLLDEVTEKIYDVLPCVDCTLTPAGFESLFQAAKKVLTPELRKQAFQLSVTLAAVDGFAEAESSLLNNIERGLEIDPQFSKRVRNNGHASQNGNVWKKAA